MNVTPRDKVLFWSKFLASILIVGFLGWYGAFQARALIFGPSLVLESPIDWQVLPGATVEVSGQVANIASLYINGRSINITQDGEFREKLPLSGRYNIIEIEGVDRFGNNEKETLTVVHHDPNSFDIIPNERIVSLLDEQDERKEELSQKNLEIEFLEDMLDVDITEQPPENLETLEF